MLIDYNGLFFPRESIGYWHAVKIALGGLESFSWVWWSCKTCIDLCSLMAFTVYSAKYTWQVNGDWINEITIRRRLIDFSMYIFNLPRNVTAIFIVSGRAVWLTGWPPHRSYRNHISFRAWTLYSYFCFYTRNECVIIVRKRNPLYWVAGNVSRLS